ncbi:DNA methyltransferase [Candidatus Palauibacter sp.]|uniref:DNA methyltransferase n=1 Tax=Candidatus Palauibacter sp. TaxID=3101350 RepID=UPI003AF315CA
MPRNPRLRRTRHRRQAEHSLGSFLERLRKFTVLDPACGSGNFLYLALHALHDLEHRVQLEAEAMGLQRAFPSVGPANVKGIELNAYAAELARVSVWIGEIQWMRRNGFPGSREPVLDPLETIECPRCDFDARRWRSGVARSRRHHRKPAVPGRQAAHH